jgi:hypothetical protein
LIKNKFNDEEYDYDGDVKFIPSKFEGTLKKEVDESKLPERIEMKELKEININKEV